MPLRIIVTILDGLHYRYLVDTGILEEILTHNVEMLVLTTPELKNKLTAAGLKNNLKFKVQELETVHLTFAQRLHLFLVNNSNKKLSGTLNVKNELKRKTKKISYFASKIVSVFASSFLSSPILKLSGVAFHSAYYEAILKTFQPDLIVFSTPGQKPDDLPLLYECLKKKIKNISPVYSWDNLTAKGPFIFNVNRLIVWNDIMKNEAIEFHGYKSEDVITAGVPVFDRYTVIINEDSGEKETFLNSLGVNSSIPTITIATIPVIYFGKCHFTLAERILTFMDSGKLPQCNILLRPHPLDGTDYTPLNNRKNIFVDYYGSAPDRNSLTKWVPREDNIAHLARTMKYSNVVINIASTITIDAACFDTPVINIAYDMKEHEEEYMGSIARYYQYTHYSHVVRVNAADLVKSDEELLKSLNAYLRDPSIKRKERLELVKQQTGKLDGLAYKRVADAILTYGHED
jgi:hypothetical protein